MKSDDFGCYGCLCKNVNRIIVSVDHNEPLWCGIVHCGGISLLWQRHNCHNVCVCQSFDGTHAP